jgi:hypothetical protein
MSNLLIAIFGLLSLLLTVKAYFECRHKKNSFGLTSKVCNIYGSFVWADHLVFGLFWTIVSLVTFLLGDWLLFLLIVSVFWLVRSVGETIYWFLQQFVPRSGNDPKNLWVSRIVQRDAAWFVHQIFWQCISVITLVTTIYLSFLWLHYLT